MRILHVNNRTSCIRTFKESKIMLERGHEVEAVAQMHSFGFNIYTRAYSWGDLTQLARTIKTSHADIVHVHSEPDWLVPFAKEHAGTRPVVYDCHDPESLRTWSAPGPAEIEAFKVADAIIHVSEPCRVHSESYHGNGKPTLMLYSYVNANFYNQARDVNWSSMVYEGGLTTLEREDKFVHYRNLTYVVQKFIESGYNVSLFAAGSSEIDLSYESMGAMMVRDLTYTAMLNGVRNHAFGFVGSPAVTKIMNAAMPNKLFEYISQGVVPVCWNADTAGEFCQHNGVGIWLKPDDDLSNLQKKLSRGPALRRNMLRVRDQWKMETQAEPLEKFYQSLL